MIWTGYFFWSESLDEMASCWPFGSGSFAWPQVGRYAVYQEEPLTERDPIGAGAGIAIVVLDPDKLHVMFVVAGQRVAHSHEKVGRSILLDDSVVVGVPSEASANGGLTRLKARLL